MRFGGLWFENDEVEIHESCSFIFGFHIQFHVFNLIFNFVEYEFETISLIEINDFVVVYSVDYDIAASCFVQRVDEPTFDKR